MNAKEEGACLFYNRHGRLALEIYKKDRRLSHDDWAGRDDCLALSLKAC
ncbi:hypothetical protein GCM10011391_19880 [Pullulanibacillus camelliae]|uniref:Uncharacterized protein n=1 Tax=Pullulanibacillus camelliae TaxID=1707096 RepID=A0A8J2VUU8_9BACL|nr:hypothetical protein GCM10011391_19880 [Pullulanibacillus camelliae]